MDRRTFLKTAGAGAALATLAACEQKKQEESPAEMPHRGEGVSLLGFGCMRFPKKDDDEIDQQAVDEMFDHALASGINYFDTAPVYGKSEEATGKSLQRYPRDKYFLATKCSNFRDHSFKAGKAMYHKSLEYFGTDYFDYYLLHALSSADELKERFLDNGLLDFLLKEKEAGHIRHLGFSFHGDAEGFDSLLALHEKYHWDFVQIQMNYVDWKHASRDASAEYMYGKLADAGIPVVIMEPLLGGRLADVPATVSDMLKKADPDKSIASWAFRFCGSFPGVLSVLSGMSCMDHLEDNLDTFLHFEPIKEKDYDLLETAARIIKDFPTVECTGCRYCMPCRFGIDIPGIFKFYNKNITDGTFAVSREQKNYRRLKNKYLLEYDKAIPSISQADHCIACGACMQNCPQGIKIPDELERIDDYIEKLKRDLL